MKLHEMTTPESKLFSVCQRESCAKELLRPEMQILPCSSQGHGCAEDRRTVGQVMREVGQVKDDVSAEREAARSTAPNLTVRCFDRGVPLMSGLRPRLPACSLLKKRRLALRRLQEAVSSFPRDSRRAALDAVPMRAKSALLRFMEVSAASSSTSPISRGVKSKRASKGPRPLLCDQGTNACTQEKKLVGGRHVTGVSLKQGGYIAQLRLVPYLQAVTRCQVSWARAAALHQVLQRARQLISTDAAQEESDCRRMQEAIYCSCDEHSVAFADLGLSFCAVVDAHGVVGCTVSGSHSTCLQEALEQRRLLIAARDSGWGSLKRVWVQLMQASVHKRSSGAWGRGCPKPKSPELAEAVADKAWQAFDLKRQTSRSKKLTKAICVLQRVLDAEDQVRPLSLKRKSPATAFKRRAAALNVKFHERTELLHAKTNFLERSHRKGAFDFGRF